MTIKELIWDLKVLLRQLTDDSSVMDKHLIHKLNIYRALFIHEYYMVNRSVEEEWFQRIPKMDVTSVNSGDDPDIPFTTIKLGKFSLPRVIELPDGLSIRLKTTSMGLDIYYKSFSELIEMIKAKDYRLKMYKFYTRIGREFYEYPYIENIMGSFILYNPLDGYEFKTEYGDLEDLEADSEYIVESGSIKEDKSTQASEIINIYKKGESFTADANATYTGNGKVKLSDQVVAVNGDYEYPVGGDIAQRIILEILTKDFQIEQSRVYDIINDSIDQLKLTYSQIGKTG